MRADDVLETCLYAPNLDAARHFYRDLLGMELFSEQPGRHLFFRAGRGVFLVFNPDATEAEAVLPPHGARGSVHVCFRAAPEALEGWAERLESAGLSVTWADWKAGRSLYVRDPAGNLVEFAPAVIWGV